MSKKPSAGALLPGLRSAGRRIRVVAGWDREPFSNLPVGAVDADLATALIADDVTRPVDRLRLGLFVGARSFGIGRFHIPSAVGILHYMPNGHFGPPSRISDRRVDRTRGKTTRTETQRSMSHR